MSNVLRLGLFVGTASACTGAFVLTVSIAVVSMVAGLSTGIFIAEVLFADGRSRARFVKH